MEIRHTLLYARQGRCNHVRRGSVHRTHIRSLWLRRQGGKELHHWQGHRHHAGCTSPSLQRESSPSVFQSDPGTTFSTRPPNYCPRCIPQRMPSPYSLPALPFSYSSRFSHAHCSGLRPAAAAFDTAITDCILSILTLPPSEKLKSQIFFPRRLGGLGFMRHDEIASEILLGTQLAWKSIQIFRRGE
jgi:hypothetical protein